ncbi:MAG TPA: hypothetical protein VGW40_16585 [Allosphingosinicella sp.]|nr:hypothetical protein [Allosphingosinicella sp.]
MARHRFPHLAACLLIGTAACSGSTGDKGGGNAVRTVAAPAPKPAAEERRAETNTATTAPPYRAHGTEPFWALTIAGGQMIYQPMEGPSVTEALPARAPIADGYLYAGNRLTVEVSHRPCSNGMSDETFADTVRVTVAGQILNGCGGEGDGVN